MSNTFLRSIVNSATNLSEQFCHSYYKMGYEQGKYDTYNKIKMDLEDFGLDYVINQIDLYLGVYNNEQ